LVGRKTSDVVENADESSFGEGQVPGEILKKVTPNGSNSVLSFLRLE